MDASKRSWWRFAWTGVAAAALAASSGCAFFKPHHGKAPGPQSATAASTNRFDSSVAAEAQKTARTNAVPTAAADNTAQNKAEANQDTLTPMDQGEGDIDRRITQDVRRAVVTGKGFSFLAQNIKIITINSVVTLRGVVENASEKARIDELAKGTSGVKKVNNQLEIKGAH